MDVSLARRIAEVAHAGQTDKTGRAYIGHPERVAGRVRTDSAQVVAWLHDVLEDTSVTVSELRAAGISAAELAAVVALTRLRDETPDDYLGRIAADPLAREVKIADLADNTDPDRVALLDDSTRRRLTVKYAHAQAFLAATDVPVES